MKSNSVPRRDWKYVNDKLDYLRYWKYVYFGDADTTKLRQLSKDLRLLADRVDLIVEENKDR